MHYLFEGIWQGEEKTDSPDNIKVRKKVPLEEVEELAAELLLRHRFVGVKFFVNRAVTHEIVRHRPCSFLQESQRYCRYSQDKFENQVTFIKPMFYQEGTQEYGLWVKGNGGNRSYLSQTVWKLQHHRLQGLYSRIHVKLKS